MDLFHAVSEELDSDWSPRELLEEIQSLKNEQGSKTKRIKTKTTEK